MSILSSLKSFFAPQPPVVLDPEREQWVHGRRSFLALGGAAMAGTIIGGHLFGRSASGLLVPMLKRGDLITIQGVYSVNPLSYVTTGRLQQFVITADIDRPDDLELRLSPRIITSGQLQTVTQAPKRGARVEAWAMGEAAPWGTTHKVRPMWHEWGKS